MPDSDDSSYVASRAIGDASITVVSDGSLLWAPHFPVAESVWRKAMPGADSAGRVWFGLNVVLIQIGAARIVVDPALDDPDTEFERRFVQNSTMEIVRSPGLGAALRSLGWEPTTVTHVVITHPHGDHYGGVMAERQGALDIRFPNARHFVGRADWEGNTSRNDPESELSRRLGAVDRGGLLDLVDGGQDIVPGVALLPTPGETPGHLAVRVHSADESLYVLGDIVHHRCEVEHQDWAPPHADARQLLKTRMSLFQTLAATDALAVAAHERFPAWRRVTRVDGTYQWETAP